MSVIYALVSPLDGRIRYIGKAVDAEKRRVGHVLEAKKNSQKNHKNNWIRKLLATGAEPGVLPLFDVGAMLRWQDAERFFIAAATHFDFSLTNRTSGGEGLSLVNDEDKARISNALKASWRGEESRSRRLEILKATMRSEEAQERLRVVQASAEYRDKKRRIAKTTHARAEVRAKIGGASKKRWADPAYREKKSAQLRAMWQDPEFRARRAASLKSAMENTDMIARRAATLRKTLATPEARELKRRITTERYARLRKISP